MKLHSRTFTILLAATIAAFLALLPVSAVMATDPNPQTINGWATFNLYSSAGLTASVSSPASANTRLTAGYGIADCFQVVDVTLAQAITMSIVSSPDGVNWASNTAFSGVSADGVTMSRIPLYGAYTGITFTVANSNPMTLTVKCTMKNNG